MLSPSDLEKLARRFCVLRGLDPDESVQMKNKPDSSGMTLGCLRTGPQWRSYLDEAADFHAMALAHREIFG